MKKLIFTLTNLLIITLAFGQVPEKMSYQAVVRNTSNELVVNTQVGMQISILHGSTSGTPVYVETQSPTTNANGVVTLEIGGGTVQSGVFADIDWTNGTYFIKTETDITGGSTYTITGTSQLLSVPYALHAKTAESLTGSGSSGGHYVGELYGGGIVYLVYDDGQHGLIASLDDLDGGSGYIWSNIDSLEIGQSAKSPWDGESNTNAIVAQLNHTTSAAQLCLDYINDGFDDWYLPAIQEFMYLKSQAIIINYVLDNDNDSSTNGFPKELMYYYSSSPRDDYWVSTEGGSTSGYKFYFQPLDLNSSSKNSTLHVRAIRKF